MDDRIFDEQTAQDWIKAVERSGKSFRDDYIYPKLNSLICKYSPQSILDIGCGQGICSEKINLKNVKYTGIEPSSFLLDRAKQLYVDKNFLIGNAYALPVSNCSFDIAFSILVFHLLSDIETAVTELSRVLSKNGHFLIVTANPDSYSAWEAMYSNKKLTGKKLEGTMQLGDALSHDILYLHTFNEFKKAFQSAGLEIEQTETFLTSKDSNLNLLILIQGRKSN